MVDIGAKTDYDATVSRMLKSIMAPETKKTTCRRKASGVLNSGIFLENILKYQNDHSEKFGGAILAQ